ncbi:MAG: DUF2815 family protein [Clostridiales bacterium]|nr:DUF2815 family protein [Clostridiales bacterium]MDU1041574.1 DUF2815 family protein [Clostridiales bacterium]
MIDEIKVATGEVRLSYAHLFKPYSFVPGEEGRYSVTCLLPKTDTVTKVAIDNAINQAKQLGASSAWKGAVPPVILTPVHDGDGLKSDGNPYGPECKGHWVFSATSKFPVLVVDSNGTPLAETDVYSGCYGRVVIKLKPYSAPGKKGIGFYLTVVSKTRDGEPLGGNNYNADLEALGIQTATAQTTSPQQAVAAPQTGVNPITGLPFN